jgi:hypothetical protein
MNYQSNLAKEYATIVAKSIKSGIPPSPKQQKKLDKLLKLLRKTV